MSRTAWTTPKMAVLAPMPRASRPMMSALNAAWARSCRKADVRISMGGVVQARFAAIIEAARPSLKIVA